MFIRIRASVSRIFLIRDSKIRIWDKHLGSATLVPCRIQIRNKSFRIFNSALFLKHTQKKRICLIMRWVGREKNLQIPTHSQRWAKWRLSTFYLYLYLRHDMSATSFTLKKGLDRAVTAYYLRPLSVSMPTSAHSSIFWWQRRGDGSAICQRLAVAAPCWGPPPRGSCAAGVWSLLAAEVEQVPTAVARIPTVSLWTGRDTKRLEFCQCCGSGFNGVPGSRRAKSTHKNRKKLINFIFWIWSTGHSLLGLKASPAAWTSFMEA